MVLCYWCLCARTNGITLSQLYSVLQNSALPWVVYGVLFHSTKTWGWIWSFCLILLKLEIDLRIVYKISFLLHSKRIISSLQRQTGWCSLANFSLLIQRITVFARVIWAIFFPILAAEKSGCVKYADFFCGGLDLGFILV